MMASGAAVAITTIFFTASSLVFVSMRLVARIIFLKNGGRDEIAIVASSVRVSLVEGSLETRVADSILAFIHCSHGIDTLPQVTIEISEDKIANFYSEVKYGLGEHIETLTTADFEEVLKVGQLNPSASYLDS